MPSEFKEIFTKKRITFLLCYGAVFAVLILIAFNVQITNFLDGVFSLFRPVIMGLVFAYICNPVFRLFERKLFCRLRPASLRRALSLLSSYLMFVLAIVLVLLLILPQLISGIGTFIANYDNHVNDAINSINGTIYLINDILKSTILKEDLLSPIDNVQFLDGLLHVLTQLFEQINVSDVTTILGDMVGTFADIIFALFISIYLLASKEKRYMQIMKIRRALFSDLTNKRITHICTTVDNLFGKFVEGRVLGSIIIGTVTYVFISLLGIPYAIVIAVFMAIINIIPYIGFFFASLLAVLVVLLTMPSKVLPLAITLFIIYQIEANVISPKIIGSNTGVSTLCVIISVATMGTLFGPIGMILGVPLFATVLDIVDSLIHRSLQAKRMPDDVDNYYAPSPILSPHDSKLRGAGKFNQWVEQKYLCAKLQTENGNEHQLSRSERFALAAYSIGRKIRVWDELTPATLTQFSAKQAERKIQQESALARAKANSSVADTQTVTADEAEEKGE